MILVRYTGRAALLGEHCDWAGGASLTVPLSQGVEITCEPAAADLRVVTRMGEEVLEERWAPQGRVDRRGGPLRFVPAAAHALHTRGLELPPVTLWVCSDLPSGRGFSSSAAFCLATLDALAQAAGETLDAFELAELAYQVEHDLLGVACGRLDPYACAAGTPLFFAWPPPSPGDAARPRQRRVTLHRPLHLALGAFDAPRNTGAILAALQECHAGSDARPLEAVRATRAALTEFASLAEQGAQAIEQGDLASLGVAMSTAQHLYDRLLAPTIPELAAPRLSKVCRLLCADGALGAKFSGAGGDGSVIALAADAHSASALANRLSELGLDAWTISLEPT